MRFLPDWLTPWRRSGARTPAHDDMIVTRFIVSSRMRRKDGGFQLKVAAFLPRAADSGRLELSVFRIGELKDDGVWALARKHVVPPGRNVHGRGDLTRSSIETTTPALQLAMDEKPPRHGNVINWPDEMDDRLALAQELVDRAIHVAPPTA